MQERLAQLKQVAKSSTRWDASAWEDKALRREVGHFQAELDSLWSMVKLSVAQSGETGVPGLGASAVKLYYTELTQKVLEVYMRVIGRAALARVTIDDLPNEEVLDKALNALSLSIAAGSSQIQRNIISERILGFPKDR